LCAVGLLLLIIDSKREKSKPAEPRARELSLATTANTLSLRREYAVAMI
jgi:hypothetical protein